MHVRRTQAVPPEAVGPAGGTQIPAPREFAMSPSLHSLQSPSGAEPQPGAIPPQSSPELPQYLLLGMSQAARTAKVAATSDSTDRRLQVHAPHTQLLKPQRFGTYGWT